MHERRQHPRYAFQRRIWCESDQYSVAMQVVDASEGGLRLRTSIPPPPGTRVRISLDEPGMGRVSADGEVVWSRRDRGRGAMGLRIVAFTEGAELWQRVIATAAAGQVSNDRASTSARSGDVGRAHDPD